MSISERTDRYRECAQKNGKIDENSNDDKEEIDSRSYVSGYIDDTESENDFDHDDDDDDDNRKKENLLKTTIDVDRDRDSAIDDSVNDYDNDVIIMGLEPNHNDLNNGKDLPLDIISTAATKSSSNIGTTNVTVLTKRKPISGCHLFTLTKRYGRQIDSVFSGFIMMFTTGFQIIWGLNSLYEHHNDKEYTTLQFSLVVIYYVGAIVGTILAVRLSSIVRKRFIHVSKSFVFV